MIRPETAGSPIRTAPTATTPTTGTPPATVLTVTAADGGPPRVHDLRGVRDAGPLVLRWPAGDRVVVSGLPGGGKSTLMARLADPGGRVLRIDSQDVRDRWEDRLPARLPYAVYRPAVRLGHHRVLWRALRSPLALLVHDCGRGSLVRRRLASGARRTGAGLHLLLLDVPPSLARARQEERGRTVSARAFRRHRRAMARLITAVEAGDLPPGCASVTLLDAPAAAAVTELGFTGE
ncbi:AAA family ATPase [Streptomyces sp. NPDC049881]|uniref:AAA family ATPase n=1 Tax=Streptomyces sp. NPDC049881 TaxID=3155778 RepID=UPI003446F72A